MLHQFQQVHRGNPANPNARQQSKALGAQHSKRSTLDQSTESLHRVTLQNRNKQDRDCTYNHPLLYHTETAQHAWIFKIHNATRVRLQNSIIRSVVIQAHKLSPTAQCRCSTLRNRHTPSRQKRSAKAANARDSTACTDPATTKAQSKHISISVSQRLEAEQQDAQSLLHNLHSPSSMQATPRHAISRRPLLGQPVN